jgi:hypothetical protein
MRDDGARVLQRSAVLADREDCHRRTLLIMLQDALAALGVQSVLVGRRVLALHATEPWGPSGPTDPELHLLSAASREIITTDGAVYRLASGHALPADDPTAAAERLAIPR